MFLLTPTQRRVLQLAAGGASIKQICLTQGIARRTAKNHMRNIYKRLDAPCRTTAVVEGIRLGEVDELQAYQDLQFRRRVK